MRVSSEPTTTTFGVCSRRTARSSSEATSFRCSATSFSTCRWCRDWETPTLVVATGLVLRSVDDLLQPPGPEAKDLAALAADERDDRAVVAADELRERSRGGSSRPTCTSSGTDPATGSGRKKSPDAKTANPRAPCRLNSLSKNSRIRAKSRFSPSRSPCVSSSWRASTRFSASERSELTRVSTAVGVGLSAGSRSR